MDDRRWEVSLVHDTEGRYPVARDVRTDALAEAISMAQRRIVEGDYPHPVWRTSAVLVQRSDQTAEAKRAAWEEAFYDVDRAGRRRRRYKKSQIERDWEAWVAEERKAATAARRAANAGRQQRGGVS